MEGLLVTPGKAVIPGRYLQGSGPDKLVLPKASSFG
jgi:hypothetical protein